MDLSPNDIRNYEFGTQMRGYDKDDVRNVLEDVATTLETMKQNDLKLSMEIDSLKTQIAGLRQFEDTIKSAAIDARRNADLTVGNAKQEAELIVSRAKTEADEIIGSRASKVTHFEDQINKLQLTKKSYLAKLRNLIKSHLEMINALAEEDPDLSAFDNDVLVTDSTDVTRSKIETIGDTPPDEEPVHAEEANAADEIIPADPEPAADEADKPVDPELAAALESYKTDHQPKSDEDMSPAGPPVPHADELIETTARAEDIPAGFVVGGKGDGSEKTGTDKIATEGKDETEAVDHNAIDIDGKTSMSPDDLADELDKVAAKFEEEMDKASQNG